MTRPRKVEIDKSLIVPIVRDAAIAGQVADGRLIPLLVLDESARQEISELIRVHAHLQPGDAESTWARSRENDDDVLLLLKFSAPMELELGLLFSIERQAILVDSILHSGALYLQTGSAGDDLNSRLDAPKVLVEIPDTGFGPVWEELLLKRMTDVMRRELGTSRQKGRDAARELISRMRSLTKMRMPQQRQSSEGTGSETGQE